MDDEKRESLGSSLSLLSQAPALRATMATTFGARARLLTRSFAHMRTPLFFREQAGMRREPTADNKLCRVRVCYAFAGSKMASSQTNYLAEIDFLARVEAAERRDNEATNPSEDPTPKYATAVPSAADAAKSSEPEESGRKTAKAPAASKPLGKLKLRTQPVREHRVHDETGGAAAYLRAQAQGAQGTTGQRRSKRGRSQSTPRPGGGTRDTPRQNRKSEIAALKLPSSGGPSHAPPREPRRSKLTHAVNLNSGGGDATSLAPASSSSSSSSSSEARIGAPSGSGPKLKLNTSSASSNGPTVRGASSHRGGRHNHKELKLGRLDEKVAPASHRGTLSHRGQTSHRKKEKEKESSKEKKAKAEGEGEQPAMAPAPAAIEPPKAPSALAPAIAPAPAMAVAPAMEPPPQLPPEPPPEPPPPEPPPAQAPASEAEGGGAPATAPAPAAEEPVAVT